MDYNYLNQFVNRLQSQGRYTFTITDLERDVSRDKSALHMALKRLVDKGRIIKVRNGFYVVIPPEYSERGILPSEWFVHDLMVFLKKPYYVSLLSAAALNGASHHQPQWLHVMTERPPIRPIKVKSVSIRFVVKNRLPKKGIIQKKTETGYLDVSNPMLTALDLIQFERHSGGFFRILEILEELMDTFNENDMDLSLQNEFPVAVIQRLGYLCDIYLNKPEIAQLVHQHLLNKKTHPVKLSPSVGSRAGRINQKWQVIENINLEEID